ncbi:MAG: hypothetical protein A3J66_01875 [Candidatus Magasanikbacteria bacterium RIFCSPHIGHO2_02_FULL_47_14]|uniref:Uncharacterized protein n=1 Tax=Candidatus Magasanikbacteria bacterium RIFCSPHIGHO2_02_FULL_47_14 TaxID=1798680 RepID=A0A1F6M2W5_9BACT|nr:MAG: hypothetical protein A3J66_01875 [Candidatus Magasanikbacteria bacterium RIFCSPHIGHO2_02_FULL_47_14]
MRRISGLLRPDQYTKNTKKRKGADWIISQLRSGTNHHLAGLQFPYIFIFLYTLVYTFLVICIQLYILIFYYFCIH